MDSGVGIQRYPKRKRAQAVSYFEDDSGVDMADDGVWSLSDEEEWSLRKNKKVIVWIDSLMLSALLVSGL